MADFKSWFENHGSKANVAIIVSSVLTSLLHWFTRGKFVPPFALTSDSLERPWSLLTYPWTDAPLDSLWSIIFYAMVLSWLYSMGNTLEKEMGSVRYVAFWFIATAVIGISILIGFQVLNQNVLPQGAHMVFLPIAAVTAAWGAKNQSAKVMFYGVIPLSGTWLVVITAVIVVLVFGSSAPLLGVFAALPMGLAYLFGAERLSGLSFRGRPKEVQATRAQARYDDKYYDDVRKREQEREERERLRKLFEGSLKDDKD